MKQERWSNVLELSSLMSEVGIRKDRLLSEDAVVCGGALEYLLLAHYYQKGGEGVTSFFKELQSTSGLSPSKCSALSTHLGNRVAQRMSASDRKEGHNMVVSGDILRLFDVMHSVGVEKDRNSFVLLVEALVSSRRDDEAMKVIERLDFSIHNMRKKSNQRLAIRAIELYTANGLQV